MLEASSGEGLVLIVVKTNTNQQSNRVDTGETNGKNETPPLTARSQDT